MRRQSVTYSAEAAFQALADPTRRAVLDLLQPGKPAGRPHRQRLSGFPPGHLQASAAILRRAHLVSERREGRHRVYQLNPEPLRAVDHWLRPIPNLLAGSNLASLKTFVEAEYACETQRPRNIPGKQALGKKKNRMRKKENFIT